MRSLISRAIDELSPDRVRSTVEGALTNFFWDPESRQTLPVGLEDWAREAPHDSFLWFEGREWTVGQVNRSANRHARAYLDLGLRHGDVAALLMDNRPAYVEHSYGLFKTGVVAALINTHVRGPSLVHAITAGKAKVLVVGAELLDAVREVADELEGVQIFVDVEDGAEVDLGDFEAWRPRLEGKLPGDLPRTRGLSLSDVAAYIYTSGTTGKPKPAVVKHHRLYRAGMIVGGLVRFTSRDTLYVCLPLYHGNGSIISVPAVILHRGRMALARRFSASRFWTDCRESGATAFIYVGELVRYLLNREPGRDEQWHQVRRAFGNGLRPDLWDPMRQRFGIEQIAEYYAATEGNAETANLLGVSGSCGPLMPWKMALARYDVERGELIRDAKGHCLKAGPGEPGLLLGKIQGKNEYIGYTDAKASQSKVLENVFVDGDRWFDTGDLLRRDRLWHLYFVDRLGDTFRWKGENVSTQEVGEILHAAPGVTEANVYGVEVPGQEGRAGMAALVVDGDFDPAGFYGFVAAHLPAYAQPRFVRVLAAMQVTGSFKQQKTGLRAEAFSAKVEDALWIRDPRTRRYELLTDTIREQLERGAFPV